MEGTSSGKLKGRKQSKSSHPKSKKHKVESVIEPEGVERKLNRDLIDQLFGSKSRGRCSMQLRAEVDKLDDKCKHIGDIWTPIRGYELFRFHFQRRDCFKPVCNLWRLNLGKMVFPNVFVYIELVKLLATHYDSKLKAICGPSRKLFVYISEASICEVF